MSTSSPKLPGYTVERLLGQGGSSEVWSARVSATGERVALKWISHADEPAGPREAAVLTALDHPHLVRLHDVVPDRSGSALVLDLAEGGSLAQLLAIRGRLEPGEVVTALSPIASALAHAHANGVTHGDVTPGNILFTGAGLPMLADLGVARLRGDVEAMDGTRCTPEYVDPAVAVGSVPGPPSDVFMLGAVAVHALTGAPMWRGATPDDVLEAARVADLDELPDQLRSAGVPAAIADVVVRATDPEPSRRGSAADFGLDLRYAAEPLPVDLQPTRRAASLPRTGPRHAAATPPSSAVFTRLLRPGPRPQLPPRRRRRVAVRWWAGAVAALVLLGGAGVAWATIGHDTGSRRPGAAASQLSGGSSTTRGAGIDEQLGLPTSTGTVSPATATATPVALSAAQAAAVLAQLDTLRENAFSRRAPLLLTGVYPVGSLLDADTQLLAKLVPNGCGLEGVQTTYDDVTVISRSGVSAVVSVHATLSPSVLVCGGTATAQAAGSGPTALRITLVWRGNGYLISDVRR